MYLAYILPDVERYTNLKYLNFFSLRLIKIIKYHTSFLFENILINSMKHHMILIPSILKFTMAAIFKQDGGRS